MISRRYRVASLIIILVALGCGQAFGGSLPLPPQRRYSIQHFGEQIGMESQTINAILQDKQGFLWFATQTGLFRFDGVSVTMFGTKQGLPSEWIDQLMLDPEGNLWAAYASKGLAKFNGQRFEILKLPGDDVPRIFQMMAFDQGGWLWVATQNGILRINPKNSKQYRRWAKPEGLPDIRTRGVYVDRDNVTWIAIGNHLGKMRPPEYKVEMLPDPTSGPLDFVNCMLMDGEGVMWIRTSKHVMRKEFGTNRFVNDDVGLPAANDSGNPTLDRQGRLMVPSILGLFRRIGGHWQRVGKAEGASNDAMVSAYEDNEGAIWMGLSGTGIDRWPDPDRWSGWGVEQGLPNNEVWGMVRDGQSRLWVATSNGLAMWDGRSPRWRVWNEKNGLGGDSVQSMDIDGVGAIWVIAGASVARVDPNTLTPTRVNLGKDADNPSAIHRGPDGKMWVGSYDYLKKLSFAGGHPVVENIPLPKDMTYLTQNFAFTRDGIMWAGGNKGLVQWDGNYWHRYSMKDGLRGEAISHMAAVNAQDVWVGYQEPALGLSHFEITASGPKVTSYGRPEGLASDSTFMVGRDSKGRLWIGSDRGMSVMDPRGRVRRYNRTDGLLWDDIDSGAFWQEPDGTILLGTTHGLARFDEAASIELQEPLKVMVTSAKLGNSEQLWESKPAGSYHQNFDVRFSAMTFRDPTAVRCTYRLNGLETEVSETPLREARYAALPSGDYDFEIRCISGTGESSVPVHFAFVIHPAWWERWWARLLFLALAFLAVWGLMRYRTRALELDRRRLEEAVEARSGELAAANRELQEASLTDPLTKIRNRRFLNSTIDSDLSQAIRAYERTAQGDEAKHRDVVFYLIDFDHFKEVNDRYGHQAGDRLLIEIARRLSRIMRATDMLVRWGGEEFLIVSRDVNREDAKVLAKRVLDEVGIEPFDLGNGLRVGRTCSIGWVGFPWLPELPDALKFEDILRLADKGLYHAKETGRNRAVGMIAAEDVRELVEMAKSDVRRTFFEIDERFIQRLVVNGPKVKEQAGVASQ